MSGILPLSDPVKIVHCFVILLRKFILDIQHIIQIRKHEAEYPKKV